MAKIFSEDKYPSIRYFLGDVRDKYRLFRAFEGIDYVIHAAALKQVVALEYNPMEAVKTNVMGADNLIEAAIDAGVKKVIALSTDKAVNPVNLYGATKLVAEKVFIAANAYTGEKVKFSVVRYGNVVGSRGSVVPLFLNLKKKGIKEYPITDINMTRFWITLEQGVEFVLKALEESVGGEIFVPKIPSMKVVDLAKALELDCKIKLIGIRPGEKINEVMISEEEARNTKIFNGTYVILPQFFESKDLYEKYKNCSSVPEGFIYRSDKNDMWLTLDELKDMVKDIE
jgi:UDP-N-acetylglucosamine 4,6-dehydratase